ncbi:conserved membrane protein of unknown function [Nitrospira sp. KM1]|uniref:AI-2E family transporter n=1 Tax=Nitrospira sp. KM1 TaxID=1936990 RepID=UPI0013A7207E|nr:AI-2E family transporter [Nitrospira sp. KM1]BCA54698.1 conserved membrane protein of unknown function [Nitrospira sp. KM1]
MIGSRLSVPQFMTRSQPFTVVFFALLLLLLYQLILLFQPFLFPIFWAALLAHFSYPLYERLTRMLGGRNLLAASTLTIGALAVVVIPLVVTGVLLVREAVEAEKAIRAWITGGGVERLPEQVAAIPLIGEWLQSLVSGDGIRGIPMEQSVLTGAKYFSAFFVDQMGGFLKDTVLLVADFFFMLLVLFFFYTDGKLWVDVLYELIPLDESHKQKIIARLDITIRAVVKGVVVTAIVQGVLAGMAYGALGVPFPIVLMALTIILAPIPLGGTALIWGPVVAYLYWIGPLWKALAMLGWGVGVVSMVDQLLRPWLIGHDVEIPILLLVFSILGGLSLYGMIGLFIGPVLVSLLITALQIYREEYQSRPATPNV